MPPPGCCRLPAVLGLLAHHSSPPPQSRGRPLGASPPLLRTPAIGFSAALLQYDLVLPRDICQEPISHGVTFRGSRWS